MSIRPSNDNVLESFKIVVDDLAICLCICILLQQMPFKKKSFL